MTEVNLKPVEVKVNDVKIEYTDSGVVELIYTPDQTQILQAGRPYRFVFELPKEEWEKDNNGC